MSKFAVILAAAGKSSRFNAKSNPFAGGLRTKPFVALNGRAVWLYSAERFALRKDVAEIVLVVSPEDRREVEERYAMEILLNRVKVVEGGAERYLSVQNALAALSPDVDYVAVHDAARPCITDGEIERVFSEALRTGAAILATPIVGSIKRSQRVDGDRTVVSSSVPRENLWEAQTPQVFEKNLLTSAYRERAAEARPTDDCELIQALGRNVSIVPGSRFNIKITTGEDLTIAEHYMDIVSKNNLKAGLFF